MAVPRPLSNGHSVQSSQDVFNVDLEKRATDAHLQNTTVKNFAWQNITVTVKDHKTKQPKALLRGVNGIVKAGTLPSYSIIERALLTDTRRNMCPHGTIRMRQNNVAECACAS